MPLLDRADAIELVDLTPDDLIQRLKEGKVYVPKQAERALTLFLTGQSDGPAPSWPCGGRRIASTSSCSSTCALARYPGPWAAGIGSLFALARIRARPPLCATPSVLPIACMHPGQHSTSRPGEAFSSREAERDRMCTDLAPCRTGSRAGGHHHARRSAHR